MDALRRNQVLNEYLERFDDERQSDVIRLTMLYALQVMKARVDLDSIDWPMLQRLCQQADHREHELQDSVTRLEGSLRHVQKELLELRESMAEPPRPNKRLDVNVPFGTLSSGKPDDPNPANRKAAGSAVAAQKEERSQYSRQTVRGIGLDDVKGSVQQALHGESVSSGLHQQCRLPSPSLRPQHSMNQDGTAGADIVPVKQKRRRYRPNSLRQHSLCTSKVVGKSAPRKKSRKPAYLKNVQSRIKVHIERDKAAAAERKRSQRRDMEYVAQFGLGKPDGERKNSRPSSKPPPPESVLGIAESFLSNPLFSKFTGPRKDTDMYNFETGQRDAAASTSTSSAAAAVATPFAELRAPDSVEELSARLRQWTSHTREAPRMEEAPDPSTYSWARAATSETRIPIETDDPLQPTRSSSELEPEPKRPSRTLSWGSSEESKEFEEPSRAGEYSSWVGDYGAPHTWTVPDTVDQDDDEDATDREDSPFRGTSDSSAWEFNRILQAS